MKTDRSQRSRRVGLRLRRGVVMAVPLAGALTFAVTTVAGAATPGFASGSVAAVSGSSMEVQNPSSGQTTVSWTSSTRFTQTLTATRSAVVTGSCVTVVGKPTKKGSTTRITATSVSITPASSSGQCAAGASGRPGTAGGFGGGFRFGGGGAGGGFRFGQGSNGSRPNFSGHFPALNFSFGSGQVTSVGGTTFTVKGIAAGSFKPPARNSKNKKQRFAKPKLTTLTVTTTSSTTYSQTQTTSASSLAVGDCVTAVGSVGSTGAVSADTVRISTSTSGSCTGSFGGAGGGFAGGGFGGGGFGGGGAAGA